MSLEEKKNELCEELREIQNLDDRYTYIIERGREHGALEDQYKTETFRVRGCMSNLWLVPSFQDGRCFFRIDSDAAIVKGVAAILAELFTGALPEEIVELNAGFLQDIGLAQYLSPNRRNSLSILYERFLSFAKECRKAP